MGSDPRHLALARPGEGTVRGRRTSSVSGHSGRPGDVGDDPFYGGTCVEITCGTGNLSVDLAIEPLSGGEGRH
jgi:hypothetical protein